VCFFLQSDRKRQLIRTCQFLVEPLSTALMHAELKASTMVGNLGGGGGGLCSSISFISVGVIWKLTFLEQSKPEETNEHAY
jgi:hypothetical protein